jgi:hypothetical protein
VNECEKLYCKNCRELLRTKNSKLSLAEMVRFGTNPPRFKSQNWHVYYIFMTNYYFSGSRCPIDNETFLMTDFMNLKTNLIQFFKNIHKNRVFMYLKKIKNKK